MDNNNNNNNNNNAAARKPYVPRTVHLWCHVATGESGVLSALRARLALQKISGEWGETPFATPSSEARVSYRHVVVYVKEVPMEVGDVRIFTMKPDLSSNDNEQQEEDLAVAPLLAYELKRGTDGYTSLGIDPTRRYGSTYKSNNHLSKQRHNLKQLHESCGADVAVVFEGRPPLANTAAMLSFLGWGNTTRRDFKEVALIDVKTQEETLDLIVGAAKGLVEAGKKSSRGAKGVCFEMSMRPAAVLKRHPLRCLAENLPGISKQSAVTIAKAFGSMAAFVKTMSSATDAGCLAELKTEKGRRFGDAKANGIARFLETNDPEYDESLLREAVALYELRCKKKKKKHSKKETSTRVQKPDSRRKRARSPPPPPPPPSSYDDDDDDDDDGDVDDESASEREFCFDLDEENE